MDLDSLVLKIGPRSPEWRTMSGNAMLTLRTTNLRRSSPTADSHQNSRLCMAAPIGDAGAMAPFGHNGRFVEIARYSLARLLARSARNLGHRIGIVRLW
jgi:hypothetical protein